MAETRREIAAEDAAWAALSDEERQKIIDERTARWDALNPPLEDDGDEVEEDEDED